MGRKKLTPEQLHASLSERFDARVRRGASDECWEWTGTFLNTGYGVISFGREGKIGAHRFALQRELGRLLSSDEHVLHSCDNPPCCNPRHLRVGDQTQNMADLKERQRRITSACLRGHVRTPENTSERVGRNGNVERHCRDCQRLRDQTRAARRLSPSAAG